MWRYRERYALGLGLVLVSSLLAVASPILIKFAIDVLEQKNTAESLGYFALALVCVAAVRALFVFRGRYTVIATSRFVEYDLRNELYRKLMRLPASFFDRNASGDLDSRVINDVEGVRMVAGVALMMVVSSLLLFLLSLAAMLMLNPKLALFSMIPMVLVSLLTALITNRIYRQSEEVQARLSDKQARRMTNTARQLGGTLTKPLAFRVGCGDHALYPRRSAILTKDPA